MPASTIMNSLARKNQLSYSITASETTIKLPLMAITTQPVHMQGSRLAAIFDTGARFSPNPNNRRSR